MTPRSIALLSIALMTLGRVADMLVTYSYTPGLELEANPLASVLGLGWPTLISVNLLAMVVIAWCSLHRSALARHYEPSADVHDLWSFASFACYGRVYPRAAFLRRRLLVPPTRPGHMISLIGAVMPITVAVVSALAVLSWEALYGYQSESYSHLYRTLWPVFPYALAIPTLCIGGLCFYKREFQRYQERCAMPTDPRDAAPDPAEFTATAACEMASAAP
jgi:hypothetical protein